MLLSVVIPVYHGAITITQLVETVQEQLKSYAFEIILINDGSKDNSEQVCIGLSEKYKNVSFLSLRKNFGEFNAVMCGLNYTKGQYTVIIDDDFQNPPSEIIKLLETAQKGNFDVVYSQYDEKKHHPMRNFGTARLGLRFQSPESVHPGVFRQRAQLLGARVSGRWLSSGPLQRLHQHLYGPRYRQLEPI